MTNSTPAAGSSTPPTPASPSTPVPLFELKILYHRKTGKVLLASSGSKFIQILYGFMSFPVSTLRLLVAGATPTLCNSVDLLENQYFRDDFDKTQLLKPRPTTFPQPDPSLFSFMNVKNGIQISQDDFRYTPRLYSCATCPVVNLTRDPNHKCLTCHECINSEATMVDPLAKTRNDAAGGGFVKPGAEFLIYDNMEIKAKSRFSDVLDFAKRNTMSNSEVEIISLPVTEFSVLLILKACINSSENILTNLLKHKLMCDSAMGSKDASTGREEENV